MGDGAPETYVIPAEAVVYADHKQFELSSRIAGRGQDLQCVYGTRLSGLSPQAVTDCLKREPV